MKSLKTFNLYQSTIKIVRTKPNQSEFVDKAILRLHNKETEFTLVDIDVDEILKSIWYRASCPPHIAAVIRAHYDV